MSDDSNKLCAECGAPVRDHVVGGPPGSPPRHPRPLRDAAARKLDFQILATLHEKMAEGERIGDSLPNATSRKIAEACHLAAEQADLRLCHCAISGDIYVLGPTEHCEVCNVLEPTPFTVENVRKALDFLSKRQMPETK